MNNCLVSVIIPVYNNENVLRRSIDSIINQDYKNIEIILVDDGSTDNSGLICDEYKKLDNRIVVIHKKNGGVSSARNVGIDKSTGDYICFVDSDDYLELNFISVLLNNAVSFNCDIVRCNYYINKNIKTNFSFEKIYDLSVNSEELYSVIINTYKFNSVWGQIISRKIINNIRFNEELKMAEDFLFNILIINNALKIKVIPEYLYNYIISENGINYSSNKDKVIKKVKDIDYLYSSLLNQSLFFQSDYLKRYTNELYSQYIFLSKLSFKDFNNESKKMRNSLNIYKLKRLNISSKYFLLYFLLKHELILLGYIFCKFITLTRKV